MENFAFKEVKDNLSDQLIDWYIRFQKADNCKKLAYKIAGFRYEPEIIEKYDNRMNFVWAKVAEIEPFETFKNGELTNKACYYLNGIQIFLWTNQIPGYEQRGKYFYKTK